MQGAIFLEGARRGRQEPVFPCLPGREQLSRLRQAAPVGPASGAAAYVRTPAAGMHARLLHRHRLAQLGPGAVSRRRGVTLAPLG